MKVKEYFVDFLVHRQKKLINSNVNGAINIMQKYINLNKIT
jgi:hypothetical protein